MFYSYVYQLEVAHRQQRRELEERFAVKEAKMKQEQDVLRTKVRFVCAGRVRVMCLMLGSECRWNGVGPTRVNRWCLAEHLHPG